MATEKLNLLHYIMPHKRSLLLILSASIMLIITACDSESNSRSETDTDRSATDTDTDSDSDSDSDSDTDSDSDSDSDSDTDSDSDSDSDGDIDHCINGSLDPGEDDIDCGGECAPCNVTYKLNPPDQCTAQFYVEGCEEGNTSSACEGNCRSANACSPPESMDKASLSMGYICPRFMLFSPEMRKAAQDDAAASGWNGSPFNYAIAGHDPDTGGLDSSNSTCCQCYQLVFDKGENGVSVTPPRPLIVQSFNTAAGGPKAFDLFMGAGGYGAFNACYNDPNFSNNSQFGKFFYSGFPGIDNVDIQQGMGGVKATSWQESWRSVCRVNDVATDESLGSAACKDKVAGHCDKFDGPDTSITSTSKYSCKQANDPASYYHMNWEVLVSRVQCPEALTRVTGCRLSEPSLPLPMPAVQTPSDASDTSIWKSGYHITTMQDCCKPTCAWIDNVGKKGLPVDGDWAAFYTCDANGVPVTD